MELPLRYLNTVFKSSGRIILYPIKIKNFKLYDLHTIITYHSIYLNKFL